MLCPITFEMSEPFQMIIIDSTRQTVRIFHNKNIKFLGNFKTDGLLDTLKISNNTELPHISEYLNSILVFQ